MIRETLTDRCIITKENLYMFSLISLDIKLSQGHHGRGAGAAVSVRMLSLATCPLVHDELGTIGNLYALR